MRRRRSKPSFKWFTSAWAGCNAGYLFRDPCESTIIMTKKGCTFNTLRGVATAICHLKEKLKIISTPRPTDKGEELITTGFPVANNKYHTALDFYFNMISLAVKMQKSPFSSLQSVKLSSLVTSCTSPLRYLVGNHTRLWWGLKEFCRAVLYRDI